MCQQGKLTHGGELMGKWSRRGFMRDAAGVAGGSVLLGTQLFVPGRPTTTVSQENQRSEAEARRPDRPEGYILDPQEGAAVGNHRIKADPKTGSMRLGVGLQQLASGKGIPIHRHEHEDEILFIHAGAGVGVVGRTVKRVNAGATIYIPAGVWHGVATEGSDVSVLWVVSPPNFAQYLEDVRQGL
jgi:quercetin dioxygenase-like cupin family protein